MPRVELRLVALQVDDDIAARWAATSATRSVPDGVVASGHDGSPAERPHGVEDPLVVGGDDHVGGAAAPPSPARRRAGSGTCRFLSVAASPGNRDEAYRAGMTMAVRMIQPPCRNENVGKD